MKVIEPSYEILTNMNRNDIIANLEKIGRECYKSQDCITKESGPIFIKNIVRNAHESVIEHFSFSVKFIVDRGVSHEMVRHRIASFTQESTRYCNYSKNKFGSEITVIRPYYLVEDSPAYVAWVKTCENAEKTYFTLLDAGLTSEEARCVLPHSLKTELIVTTNLREWRHILKLRGSVGAHPQMRQVIVPLYQELSFFLPEIFGE